MRVLRNPRKFTREDISDGLQVLSDQAHELGLNFEARFLNALAHSDDWPWTVGHELLFTVKADPDLVSLNEEGVGWDVVFEVAGLQGEATLAPSNRDELHRPEAAGDHIDNWLYGEAFYWLKDLPRTLLREVASAIEAACGTAIEQSGVELDDDYYLETEDDYYLETEDE